MMKAAIFALATAALLAGGAEAAQSAPQMSKPHAKCYCKTPDPNEKDIFFKGVVVDAELTVDSSGLSVTPRQATIFRAIEPQKLGLENPIKVWHVTNPDKCGVTFDYGKEYTVKARKKDDALETDLCLMKDYLPKEEETAQ